MLTATGMAALAGITAVLTGVTPAVAFPGDAARAVLASSAVADDGARVIATTPVSARVVDLTIASPALHGNGLVRLVLPTDWSSRPTATWPSLYLLHGANEVADYTSWTTFTDVESFLAESNVLTVLPTDGSAGMYSASWSYGHWSGPDYETFHTQEIPQILTRGFRANDVRAVAGLSIGGLGAMDYAARHPGLFRAAASYSGMLHTLRPGVPAYVAGIKVRAGQDPAELWGSPVFQRSVWKDHDPYELAPRLRGVALYVSSGDGAPGPLDRAATPDLIEPLAYACATDFVARLKASQIPVTTHLYRGGTHTWPYWQAELHASWPLLATALGVTP